MCKGYKAPLQPLGLISVAKIDKTEMIIIVFNLSFRASLPRVEELSKPLNLEVWEIPPLPLGTLEVGRDDTTDLINSSRPKTPIKKIPKKKPICKFTHKIIKTESI